MNYKVWGIHFENSTFGVFLHSNINLIIEIPCTNKFRNVVFDINNWISLKLIRLSYSIPKMFWGIQSYNDIKNVFFITSNHLAEVLAELTTSYCQLVSFPYIEVILNGTPCISDVLFLISYSEYKNSCRTQREQKT